MDHLFLVHQSPYADHRAKESIDLILATALFHENTAVVFINDGVFQLVNHQQTDAEHKNVGKAIQAFTLYDINNLWVDEASLIERGLSHDDIPDDVRLLSHTACQDAIHQAKSLSNLT